MTTATKGIFCLLVLLGAMCAHATVVVTVSPASATLYSAGTQQFSSIITGAAKNANLAVTWTTSAGSISASGLFTAPTVTTQTAVTIRATGVAPHKPQFGTASVTVLPVIQQHSVNLTWGAVVGAVGYSVYRGALSGGPFSLLSSALQTASYTDTTVVSGETFYYVATDTDAAGQESGYSNVAQAVIPSP